MKNLKLLLLVFLFSTLTFCQKKYAFDYILEYKYQLSDTSKVEIQYFLTNSKDNSYFINVKDKDSLNFTLNFVDYNGIKSVFYLDKVAFSKAESISLECKLISKNYNPFIAQRTKEYDFKMEKDTVIEGNYFSQYLIRSNSPKREKKKKLGAIVYVVEKNSAFHFPLLDHPTAYEEWKLEKNIPNGIPKFMYFKDFINNKKSQIFRLVQYVKINKYLIIPEECDYSNPKSKILNQ